MNKFTNQSLINQAIEDCAVINQLNMRWARLTVDDDDISLDIGMIWTDGKKELAHIKRRYSFDSKGEPRYFDSMIL